MKFWIAEYCVSRGDDPWVVGYYDSLETALWDLYERPKHPLLDTLYGHTWTIVERTADCAILLDEMGDQVEIHPIIPASRESLEATYAR